MRKLTGGKKTIAQHGQKSKCNENRGLWKGRKKDSGACQPTKAWQKTGTKGKGQDWKRVATGNTAPSKRLNSNSNQQEWGGKE